MMISDLNHTDSPQKRRQYLRESEKTHGEISIEENLYCCATYRSTSLPNMILHLIVTGSTPESDLLIQRPAEYICSRRCQKAHLPWQEYPSYYVLSYRVRSVDNRLPPKGL